MENIAEKKMSLIYGDTSLGMKGDRFHYIFTYGGGPESIVIDGKEWLYRCLRPTFWRATTDNDRGNRLHFRSAMWYSADAFLPCRIERCIVDGKDRIFKGPENNIFDGTETAEKVELTYNYKTLTIPETTVEVKYVIHACGKIVVTPTFHGEEGLPELPVFGMRFVMPTKACGFDYEGLSGETYPDRMAGGEPGIYHVDGLPVTPHLVPQDCGVHMDTSWVKIYRDRVQSNIGRPIAQYGTDKDLPIQPFGIQIGMVDQKFAFSCLPYTAHELENATHQEELPPARRTVLCVLGAVRGVGGMDSWGADVEEAYKIKADQDISYSFSISPIETC